MCRGHHRDRRAPLDSIERISPEGNNDVIASMNNTTTSSMYFTDMEDPLNDYTRNIEVPELIFNPQGQDQDNRDTESFIKQKPDSPLRTVRIKKRKLSVLSNTFRNSKQNNIPQERCKSTNRRMHKIVNFDKLPANHYENGDDLFTLPPITLVIKF